MALVDPAILKPPPGISQDTGEMGIHDAQKLLMTHILNPEKELIIVDHNNIVQKGWQYVIAFRLLNYPKIRVKEARIADPLSSPHTPQSGTMCISNDQSS
jgi:hypothetical protein